MADDAFRNFERKSINAVRIRQEKDIQASKALPRTSVYGECATEEDPILDRSYVQTLSYIKPLENATIKLSNLK